MRRHAVHAQTDLTSLLFRLACLYPFSIDATAAISPPSVAMASILFLVLGDMCAAIIGVSFGGDAVPQLRLGREGKKSIEGSLAMFVVCFLVGTTMVRESARTSNHGAEAKLPSAAAATAAPPPPRRRRFPCPATPLAQSNHPTPPAPLDPLRPTSQFAHVHLREYPVFFGALVATLTELYEPFLINDNLTIPVFSSLAMQLAFRRIASC